MVGVLAAGEATTRKLPPMPADFVPFLASSGSGAIVITETCPDSITLQNRAPVMRGYMVLFATKQALSDMGGVAGAVRTLLDVARRVTKK